MKRYTPMIQQYLKIKAEYEDAFLFFRLGDFYELFFEDAIKASQELEITLTARDGGVDEKIPMCGVPYHSAQGYIETLVNRGYKVAIAEQLDDPKQTKGMVRREVVQLITPGTMMEGKSIRDKVNNYISTITAFPDETFGLAFCDLSTGESKVTLITEGWTDCINELATIQTKEIVLDENFPTEFSKELKERLSVTISYENEINISDNFEAIIAPLSQNKLIQTAARLLNYLYRTQKRSLDHMQPIETYQIRQYMKMDYYSKRNLELTETIRTKGKKGSLLWLLDETKTAMGGRLLKQWIDRPLISQEKIESRLHIVEQLKENFFERQELREKLTKVYDIERLAGKVAFGNVNARDLVNLKTTLYQIPDLMDTLSNIKDEKIQQLAGTLDPCSEIADLIERSIVDHPPISIKEGNMIRDGYHEQLDMYRDASRNGKTWIAELEKAEREKTGIKSLKIGFNRVFGYYIEVTKANLHLLPKDRNYERKQTLTNAERFITPELKEKESMILEAEEKSVDLEYELFLEIRNQVKEFIPRLQTLAKKLSEIDCLQCFAEISENRKYTKPVFNKKGKLTIKEGRHPVVEKVMDVQTYVPNDCIMNKETEILLITGPNMSGKSTFMRQVALTAILAQIGCFVPAEHAELPIFDQIFTRIGAADDLISGQSTFMVEMLEARNAIRGATENSLILFDEIGRGTSTYDGMALAQAMIEYIHDKIGAKTLFSTHYHELTALEKSLKKLKNVHVSAIEKNGQVVFLHKIKEGPTDKSYGIHVAKLADMPAELIQRAETILQKFEKNGQSIKQNADEQQGEKMLEENRPFENEKDNQNEVAQLSFFDDLAMEKNTSKSKKEQKILSELKNINLLEMTPIDAMNALYQLQKKLK
ncbi:DNA mismatch repair protein MutS [Caldibacillus thermolactis]|jgi:DNA mismatch repair protein MutS|uniref:DNA mismatch repair protein MutS n=1 Tax=Pallidibacillus thermolactis TaxID=251051 RepID=A0ABT2WJC4_9BACI|nr:DNA mismatch repair protein MutS [Pallidibacillus thermolactis]MCU9595497.1 DNA mismatch repair protein MutS [Pallidibacillus thermolactis]MED1674812.1 DNA mismatch repair protein MutS [Pallidibacillus thermolactis subsp. kokeshiiformis]